MVQPARELRSVLAGSAATDEVWTREALRLHGRYLIEVVEASGLCPWAESARKAGKVRNEVVLGEDGDLAASLAALDEVGADASTEVAFLVYPRFAGGRAAFESFAVQLRTADTGRHALGQVPFVFAVFHPDAAPDTGDPERLIPFLRRTPDPTLQFVRASVLDAVRSLTTQGTQFVSLAALEAMQSGHVPLSLRERIARTNLATVQRMGIDAMRAKLDEVRRDRDETYARLRRER
jgi:hypothetical protein